MLYQRPQADMAGEFCDVTWVIPFISVYFCAGLLWAFCVLYVCLDSAEKLFDLVDSFAESAKRKAAVWPLQIILLILCPEITQSISKEVVDESKANKVSLVSVDFLSNEILQ